MIHELYRRMTVILLIPIPPCTRSLLLHGNQHSHIISSKFLSLQLSNCSEQLHPHFTLHSPTHSPTDSFRSATCCKFGEKTAKKCKQVKSKDNKIFDCGSRKRGLAEITSKCDESPCLMHASCCKVHRASFSFSRISLFQSSNYIHSYNYQFVDSNLIPSSVYNSYQLSIHENSNKS